MSKIAKSGLCVFVTAVVVLALVGTAVAADKPKVDSKFKNVYQNIEVTRYGIQEGVEFPVDWLLTMVEETVKQLQETKKFKEVLREGETPATADAATLKLDGTVIHYDKGNRAMRYIVGFGAGKTKVVAHIKITDKSTGELIFEDDVDGKVIMGGMGGDSLGATEGLAKEVAKKIKKEFFK